jgi:hypothetical protein
MYTYVQLNENNTVFGIVNPPDIVVPVEGFPSLIRVDELPYEVNIGDIHDPVTGAFSPPPPRPPEIPVTTINDLAKQLSALEAEMYIQGVLKP